MNPGRVNPGREGAGPIRWLAPAKINLFLHILGRREDGYHELQTVFQFLDICDEIKIVVRPDGEVRQTTSVNGVEPEDDLTIRAARALQKKSAGALGADIGVHKVIPIGAGLGGGSSDCAVVLLALNQLWALGLSVDELAKLGRELGADVPVFVRGRAAWGEGVGENLTPVTLPQSWYLVVVPACEVPTAAVFGASSLTRNSAPTTIRACFGGAGNAGECEADILHLFEHTRNDCEALVRERYAAVDAAMQWANEIGNARMTGTGAAVFVPFASEEQARNWADQVPQGWQSFVARGLNESPALEQLDRFRQG